MVFLEKKQNLSKAVNESSEESLKPLNSVQFSSNHHIPNTRLSLANTKEEKKTAFKRLDLRNKPETSQLESNLLEIDIQESEAQNSLSESDKEEESKQCEFKTNSDMSQGFMLDSSGKS